MSGEWGWEPTRWYRVLSPDGTLWAETSDRAEAVSRMRPGDTLVRVWHRAVRTRETEMREEQP